MTDRQHELKYHREIEEWEHYMRAVAFLVNQPYEETCIEEVGEGGKG